MSRQIFDYTRIRSRESGGQTLYFLNDALSQLDIGPSDSNRKPYYQISKLIRPDDVTERVRRRRGQKGETGHYVPKSVLYRAVFLSNAPQAVELQNFIIDRVAPEVIERGYFADEE